MFSPLAMEVKSQVLSIIAQPFSGCGAREAPTVPQSLSCASHGRKWDLGAYVFIVSFFFFFGFVGKFSVEWIEGISPIMRHKIHFLKVILLEIDFSQSKRQRTFLFDLHLLPDSTMELIVYCFPSIIY